MKSARQAMYALGVCLLFHGNGMAANLSISPTRVTIDESQTIAAITLRNSSSEESIIQVETFSWEDEATIEALKPTREIMAVPAVFHLPAGARQVIRIRAREAPAINEQAYRLVLSEVPDESPKNTNGVQFALRLNLPVFVAAPGSRALPRWSHARNENGARSILLTNDGNAHLRVHSLAVSDDSGRKVEIAGVPFDLLPGRNRELGLGDGLLGTSLRIEAETNLGAISTVLVP